MIGTVWVRIRRRRRGGDLYMHFSLCSADSRYGCWGLSEDIVQLHTPEWQAIDSLARGYSLIRTRPTDEG